MSQGVYVTKITGEVFLSNGEKTFSIKKEQKLGVNLQYEVVTAEKSYTYITDNPNPESKRDGFFVCLFPKTKVIVHTGRGFIKKLEIITGLIFGMTSITVTPTAEFKSEWKDACWIEVDEKGQTTVANTRDTIVNKKTKKMCSLSVNQQVLVTENDICEPEPMEQRYYQAKKILDDLVAFGGTEMYQLVAEKSDALLEASLMALKSLSEQTGQDFEKLKEEAIKHHQMYKQWAHTQSEELYEIQQKVKSSDLNHDVLVIPVNKTLQYQDITCTIILVRRETKSDEKDLLSINIEVKNNSSKELFIFWNEEIRLLNENGDILPVDDYNLETNLMPGSDAKGYLFILVPQSEEKFKLQFGKKSLPKVEMGLDLSKNKEGSD